MSSGFAKGDCVGIIPSASQDYGGLADQYGSVVMVGIKMRGKRTYLVRFSDHETGAGETIRVFERDLAYVH